MNRVRKIGLTALVVAMTMGLVATSASAESYEQVRSWEVGSPFGIAVDAQSNVYVVSIADGRVTKFTSEGRLLTSWGGEGSASGQFNAPSGIEVDRTGRVFVADGGNNRVQLFTPDGAFLGAWATPAGDPDDSDLIPQDIDFDAENRAYVVSGSNVPGLFPIDTLVTSPTGDLLDRWGTEGTSDGQLTSPRGVATDPQGNVWIADQEIPRVQRFTPAGGFLSAFGQVGSDPGQLREPMGLDIDAQGNLYVPSLDGRVDKFAPDGSLITSFGQKENADGVGTEVGCPTDVAVGPNGDVYVADDVLSSVTCAGDERVHVYRQSSGPGPGDPGANRVKIASKSLKLKQNKIKVKIKCLGSGQCKGKLQIKKGKKAKLAKGSYKLPAGKTKNITAKPTKQGKRQLKRTKEKLKVTVELTPTGGGEKVTRKLKLKG